MSTENNVTSAVPDSAIPFQPAQIDIREKHTKKEKKELQKKRMERMTKEEVSYLKRKNLFDKGWPIFRFVILFGLCFVILYPVLYMLTYTFRLKADMNDPTIVWLPRHFTMQNLKDVLRLMDFGNTLRTTLLLNIGCSVVQVITTAITGYGFARFKFKGKNLLFFVVILMIMVPTQIILIPQYMQFRYFISPSLNINLINTPWTMYLPAMTANGIRSGLMILIFRQFFRGLPKELEDAAYLDGCGPLKTFVQIMVPNAASSFLTVFLFSIVWYWNDYYVSNSFFTEGQTISLKIRKLDVLIASELYGDATIPLSMREKIVWLEAGCLLSILPLLILYCFLQKYFTEGIARAGLVG